jgi:hypothetical protein
VDDPGNLEPEDCWVIRLKHGGVFTSVRENWRSETEWLAEEQVYAEWVRATAKHLFGEIAATLE